MGAWFGHSANVCSSLATEVQFQRDVKAAPRGAASVRVLSIGI